MKKLLLLICLIQVWAVFTNAQSYSKRADSAYVFPDSLCVSCNGSVWQTPMNPTGNPPTQGNSKAFLLPYNQCNQDTCYYTREFRFCNYGFNIPLNATVDSFTVHIYEGATVRWAIKDSVIQLMKNHTAVGDNIAYPYPWDFDQGVYYPTGLYGATWTPQEVNDPSFGLVIRVKNFTNDTVSALIEGSRIDLYYTTPNAIFSQSSGQYNLVVYPNPANNYLTIETSATGDLKIYNTQGQLVTSSIVEGQHTTIDVSSFASGLYYLTLQSKEGVITKKVEVVR
jgi:hypothetical protein